MILYIRLNIIIYIYHIKLLILIYTLHLLTTKKSIEKIRQQKTLSQLILSHTATDDVNGVVHQHFIDLLTKMLDINPSTRITAEQAMKHKFFDNIRSQIQLKIQKNQAYYQEKKKKNLIF